MANAKRDANNTPTILGVSSSDMITPIPIVVDPITWAIKVSLVWTWFVSWPVSAIDSNIAVFDTTAGNKIKDWGVKISDLVPYSWAIWNVDLWIHNILSNSLWLNTSPTIPTAQWSLYYDVTYWTLSTILWNWVVLQIWQEHQVNCHNSTWVTIPNWSIVYQNWVHTIHPTIDLALANSESTSDWHIIWMATENILNWTEWKVTTSWLVNWLDTSAYTSWTVVYLSPTIPWWLTSIPPSAPNSTIKMGTVIVSDAVNGSILIGINTTGNLNLLSDVNYVSPTTQQALMWNGSIWTNQNISTVSASNWVNLYFDETIIIPAWVWPQTFPMETLAYYPSWWTEVIESVTVNSGVNWWIWTIAAYETLNALNRTKINAWVWTFDYWRYVSNTSWVSELITKIEQSVNWTWTITITGTWTTRTATVTWWTPFVSWDVGADITSSSSLQTPNGIFPIIWFTSSSQVTIQTLSTYTNESAVNYRKNTFLFNVTTWDINDTTVTEQFITYTQTSDIILNATDKLTAIIYWKTNSWTNKTINFVHNWTVHYSNIRTPLVTLHNDLWGIQWIVWTDAYHLWLTQYTNATQNSDWTHTWLLSSTDWTTFNNKVPSTRNLTINWTTYDLSADRSWTISKIVPLTNTEITNTATTINANTTDIFTITALASADTIWAPTWTPVNWQKLIIRIKDNGTAQTLSWNTIFRASSDLALPTTTIINKTLYLWFIYNSTDTKWDLIALLNNF